MGSLQAARCHVADLIQIPHEWSSDNDYLHEVFLYKLAHSLGTSPLGMQPPEHRVLQELQPQLPMLQCMSLWGHKTAVLL